MDFLFPIFLVLVGFLFPIFFEFPIFFIGAFLFFSFPPNSHYAHGKKEGTRELSSALVRAVVAPRNLVESKFPAILDRYNWFSELHIDS